MSEILLNALASCKTEQEFGQVYDLAKGTKVSKEAVDTAIENVKRLGFKIGGKVLFYGDKTDVGTIVKFNTSTIGFYTGDRYPLVIKFDRGTFEYGPEGLTPMK